MTTNPTTAELAARITAARAVLGDYRQAEAADATWEGPAMPWATWAGRLASMLGSVLAGQPPALTTEQLVTLGQALADAVEYHDPAGDFCADCEVYAPGLCRDHQAAVELCDRYRALAAELGAQL